MRRSLASIRRACYPHRRAAALLPLVAPPRTCRHDAPSSTSFFHSSSSHYNEPQLAQEAADLPAEEAPELPPVRDGIRSHLRLWRKARDLKKRAQADAAAAAAAEDNGSQPEPVFDPSQEIIDEDALAEYMACVDKAMADPAEPAARLITYHPGDLVELPGTSSLSTRLAVYIRSSGGMMQFYTIAGTVQYLDYVGGLFVSHGFAVDDDIRPIAQHLPDNELLERWVLTRDYSGVVPRHVGQPLIQRMRAFESQTIEHSRTYADVFAAAHAHLAPKAPQARAWTSLTDAAATLTGLPKREIPDTLLLACSMALLRGGFGFAVNRQSYGETRDITIFSRGEVATVRRVFGWVSNYVDKRVLQARKSPVTEHVDWGASRIEEFAAAVRPLIQRSRQARHGTSECAVVALKEGAGDRALLEGVDTQFSKDAREILAFIRHYVCGKSFFYHDSLKSCMPFILRAVGEYEGQDLDANMLFNFMVECGAMQPYENPDTLDLSLEPEPRWVQPHLQEAGPAGLEDAMESARHDFGDLPVFCIDAAYSRDIDDGVSIEDVPESAGERWLHVHTAGVGAFISPGSPLARFMAGRLESSFLPERLVRALPDSVAEHFSLSAGPGRPTLSISMRLSETGQVLETKLRAGIVNNVLSVPTDAVDAQLGYEKPTPGSMARLNVGEGETFEKRQSDPLTADHLDALRRLTELGAMLRAGRLKRSPFSERAGDTKDRGIIHVEGLGQQVAIATLTQGDENARFADRDPGIRFRRSTKLDNDVLGLVQELEGPPSRLIVEEAMVLANKSAAEWAAVRGIPVPFAGTRHTRGGLELEKQQMRRQIEAMARGSTPYNPSIFARFTLTFLQPCTSTVPIAHQALGIDVYTHVTSPIRSFTDLMAHWNLNAAILEEAKRGGEALKAEEPKPFLPLDDEALFLQLKLADVRRRELLRISAAHRKHWQVQAAMRAFYLGEGKLPDPVIVRVDVAASRNAVMEGLEFTVEMREPKGLDGNMVRSGDRWEARIVKIQPGTRSIVVEPVRRLVDGYKNALQTPELPTGKKNSRHHVFRKIRVSKDPEP